MPKWRISLCTKGSLNSTNPTCLRSLQLITERCVKTSKRRGEIFPDSVWEHLAGTISEPFVAGEHKQIAVKVIDDRGNELLVVKKLSEAQKE